MNAAYTLCSHALRWKLFSREGGTINNYDYKVIAFVCALEISLRRRNLLSNIMSNYETEQSHWFNSLMTHTFLTNQIAQMKMVWDANGHICFDHVFSENFLYL